MTADAPAIAGALMRLAGAVTRDQACEHIAEAMNRGLPWSSAVDLLDRWVDANEPQVIGSPRCRCSHIQDHHYIDRRGKTVCRSAACGCAELRTGERK